MFYRIIVILAFGLFSFTANTSTSYLSPINSKLSNDNLDVFDESKIATIYYSLNANNYNLPKLESFSKALVGFYQLKEKGIIKKDILTLLDFSLSSNTKRFWVIDMKSQTILYQSLVAHGRNSGGEFAKQFSNLPESYQSSLGFYATGETYIGKHGYSLRLDGLEKGINHKARERAIVIHGADYVSENFIQHHGRLGRSFGCPSLPNEISKEIIDIIKEKSCLFIYSPATKI